MPVLFKISDSVAGFSSPLKRIPALFIFLFFEASIVKLYPNPATNILNIESAFAIEKVAVYNLLGQEVISQNPNTELVTLDVASLQVGVYVVKTSIDGNISSTRFIKE